MENLREALEEIIAVASGARQVAVDDTEGMEWIDKRARKALAAQAADQTPRASSEHEYVGGIQDEDSEIYSCCSCGWKCQGPLPGCHEKWLRRVAETAQTTPPPSEGRDDV